jgi:DNA helicase-2/ATP-dependent DNA helicase PcrA
MSNELIGIDKEIYGFLNLDDPKSFLLFAGAGSGKTRTLVNVLQEIRNKNLKKFIDNGQRIAVITYTNAACLEIKHRLQYDPIFSVSTIHSFIWELIKPFTLDIKAYLEDKLNDDIDDLTTKIFKARDKNGKTALTNARRCESKKKRLNELKEVNSFTYSPTSNSVKKGTLNHAEVIAIGAIFLADQELMQSVLINRYPILLIDESQDTNKALLDAFISVQQNYKNNFSLGLFGDMMQRIYSGGKDDLINALPSDWETPAKKVNFRSPKRIINLINNIRKDVDDNKQEPKGEAIDGVARLFVVDSSTVNKFEIERQIRQLMAECTLDKCWESECEVKTLTLEHAMAASRGAFDEFLLPLSTVDSLKDSALNGSNKNINFITGILLPFISSILEGDLFEVTRLIKNNSMLICNANQSFIADPLSELKKIDQKVSTLKEILKQKKPLLKEILAHVSENNLLTLPEDLASYLVDINNESIESKDDSELASSKDKAWSLALNADIDHVKNYAAYVSGSLGYATHQGVKGLEFKRVMAILDDDFKGFLFDYEKLFGVKTLTKKDIENESVGKDSAVSRTRRLFYVICSRAEKSLAVVAYSKDPLLVKQRAIEAEWFSENEIVLLDSGDKTCLLPKCTTQDLVPKRYCELEHLKSMWSSKIRRKQELIVPLSRFNDESEFLSGEDWFFNVHFAFRSALDINYVERKKDKKSYMVWIQGPILKFKEGDMLHSSDGATILQVKNANPMGWDSSLGSMYEGTILFEVYENIDNKISKLKSYTCTQMGFLEILITGEFDESKISIH